MLHQERQIRTAQRRLWINRWLRGTSWSLAVAAVFLTACVLFERLLGIPVPVFWISVGLAGGALVASVVWMIRKRENAAVAAATLDQAAGLRERLSSGHHCRASADPFAQAVVADAEKASKSLSARQHIRLSAPWSFALTAAAIAVALMSFAAPVGLFRSSEAAQNRESAEAKLMEARIAVKRTMDAVRQMAEVHPVLEDMQEDLDNLDKEAGGKLQRPADIRHEGVKKIDRLADALRRRRESAEYESVNEMRKILRGLKTPTSLDASTQKLTRALLDGDFKSAKQEIEALRKRLATLGSGQDKAVVAKISRDLEDLAKQLEKSSQNAQLAQQLRQAGIKQEELERMLNDLTEEDVERLKKRLEEQGMSQQQIQKLVQQLRQRQQAGNVANKLARALSQGAMASGAGQMAGALAGLSMAADQLSELEQLEQEANELSAVLANLQDGMDNLSRPCPSCGGVGCQACQGGRGGMGRMGQGRGGLAPEEQTTTGFKTKRAKAQTGRGAIIGQLLFDGDQVKGDVRPEFAELVTTAEHEASDRIDRDRIPRQYHRAVKAYFSNVQRSIEDREFRTRGQDVDATDGTATGESSGQSPDGTQGD